MDVGMILVYAALAVSTFAAVLMFYLIIIKLINMWKMCHSEEAV